MLCVGVFFKLSTQTLPAGLFQTGPPSLHSQRGLIYMGHCVSKPRYWHDDVIGVLRYDPNHDKCACFGIRDAWVPNPDMASCMGDTLRRNPEWVKGSALRNELVERLDDAHKASMRIEKPNLNPQCCGGCKDPDAHTIVHEDRYSRQGISAPGNPVQRAYPREEFFAACEKFNREKLLDRGFQCRVICTLPRVNDEMTPCVLLILVEKRSDEAHDELFLAGKEPSWCRRGFQTSRFHI